MEITDWQQTPSSTARQRRLLRRIGLAAVLVLGLAPLIVALVRGTDPAGPIAALVILWGITAFVAWRSRRNAVAGFVPPAGVTYLAQDPELGAALEGAGLPISSRTFDNVVTFESGGRPFTYFEAVDDEVRRGYLVTELDGSLPTLMAALPRDVRTPGRRSVAALALPHPLGAGFALRSNASDNEAFLADFLTPAVTNALTELDLSQWRIHGRFLTAFPALNTAPKDQIWTRLERYAGQLAALADAIPTSLFDADDGVRLSPPWTRQLPSD
ncbi:MAG: hypothetical protein WAV45_15930 [Propionibacteriaceae bacterium]|nr:hypothetical protein [Micropruina sp.]